ncbi:MAG: hypothetical protein AAF772_04595 [Acidobacteriota bacterium]
MDHSTRDTYPLTHFHQNPSEHLARLAKGRVETLTQDGEAAMVVMSPETYDMMQLALERGDRWKEAIARFDAGERGVDAREAIATVATRLGLDL